MLTNQSSKGLWSPVWPGCVMVCCLALLGGVRSAYAGVCGGTGLACGTIKVDGIPIVDRNGVLVATKRVTILWRYSDTDGDGLFTWGGEPLIGDDFRMVNRAIYTFTSDFVPDPDWNGQMSTFHWGPLHLASGLFRPTVFRGTRYDDFMPGLPVPGDFLVSQGMDGLPVPGITASGSLFIDNGDWDPNNGITPLTEPRWGMRYFLTFAVGTPRVIPAGTVIFFDSQTDMQHLAPDTCENGWSEEDWITTGGPQGFTQPGPSTADPASFVLYPTLAAPPLLFITPGHVCDPAVCGLLGDIDGNGLINSNDIAGFIRAKLGQLPAPGERQGCANFGGSIAVDNAAFVAALLTGP